MLINWQRYTIEEENKTIDLAMDYEDVLFLAKRAGKTEQEVLQKVKEAGITSLCVYDKTFKKLNQSGKVTAISGSELLASYRTGSMVNSSWQEKVADGTISADRIYITGQDDELLEEIIEDLKIRLGKKRVNIMNIADERVVSVQEDYESFLKMDLSLARSEMKKVNEAGFFVLARPTNIHLATTEDVQRVLTRLDGIQVSEIVFSGKEILGYPEALDTLRTALMKRAIPLGLIEHTTQLKFYPQKGLLETAKALDYKVARVYSIAKDEQVKMTIADAQERWSNTNLERNIRINLLRIYEKPAKNLSLLDTNLNYIQNVRERLAEDGFSFGKASLFPMFFPHLLSYIPLILGVSAAAIFYLTLINPTISANKAYVLTLVLACFSLLFFYFNSNLLRTVYAFLSANFFPTLAMIFALDFLRNSAWHKMSLFKKIVLALCLLFPVGVFSFIGAAYLSGFLADTEYLLEAHVFRGVKLTFILPLILVTIAFLARFSMVEDNGNKVYGVKKQLQIFLQKRLTIFSLVVFLGVLLTAIIFIGRSGHTMGVPVPAFELKFRAFLEEILYVRPRSKEIFLGHPAFILAVTAFVSKWKNKLFFLFILLATIGEGSMVETFAHMRTPIFISFVRGVEGIVLGSLLGVLVYIFLYLCKTSFLNVGDKSAAKGKD